MGRLDMREINGAVGAEEGIELAISPRASAASCSSSGLEEGDDRGRSSNSSNSSDELL